jgi:uncharacterized protein DUF4214
MEQAADLITAAYRALLGREPDPDGFNHYMRMLANGVTEPAIRETLAGLVGSAEFADKFAKERKPRS